MSKNFVKRVLSGVQPTGGLHIGNYLGAIKNFVDMQNQSECLFCIVDLHAITVWQDPKLLDMQKREVAAAFIASGIDPEKNSIFNQSEVPEHSQLAWLLNCTSQMGWLKRMTQFKDKAGKNQEKVSVGLFTYPVLMAADILVYKATHVPVGDDQKQHLELTRDIVIKFNNDYKKEIFPLPEPLILKSTSRVMSLKDGQKKMSKSDPSDLSRIMLTDEDDDIRKKISKAKTDEFPFPDNPGDLEKRPEAKNLITIFSGFTGTSIDNLITEYAGKNFSHLKSNLSEVVISGIKPIREEMKKLLEDKNHLDKVTNKGTKTARTIAAEVLKEVYETVGLK